MSNADALRGLFLDEGRRWSETGALVIDLGLRLQEIGLAVERVNLSIPTLHPQIVGLGFVWSADEGLERLVLEHGELSRPRFVHSPIARVMRSGEVFHTLLREDDVDALPLCLDLARRGFTAYHGRPLLLSDGKVAVVSYATRAPGGFDDATLAALAKVDAPLALWVDAHEARRTAGMLLRTWVGPRSGERVLAGVVQRGAVETIRAAIWYADLRGFTEATLQLTPVQVLDHLNAAFEVMVDRVEAGGGEVLKLIGDGLLAIFPAEQGDAAASSAAVEAALEVQVALARVSAVREADGLPALAAGVGVHVGDVLYGNVGARQRLDFTVIGHAVNVAARLEGLCGRLGEPLLVSEAVAAQVPRAWRDLGVHPLKGMPTPLRVMAPG